MWKMSKHISLTYAIGQSQGKKAPSPPHQQQQSKSHGNELQQQSPKQRRICIQHAVAVYQ